MFFMSFASFAEQLNLIPSTWRRCGSAKPSVEKFWRAPEMPAWWAWCRSGGIVQLWVICDFADFQNHSFAHHWRYQSDLCTLPRENPQPCRQEIDLGAKYRAQLLDISDNEPVDSRLHPKNKEGSLDSL